MRAVVVGGGSWGTAVATRLRDRDHDVVLACRDAEQAATITATGHNLRYAEGADLAGITATTIAEAPVAAADLVVVAVPSKAFRDVVTGLPGSAPVLSLTKGLDPGTGERLSTLVRDRPVAVLSGPNISEEVLRGLPAAAVIASDEPGLAVELQHAINSIVFRVYVNDDVVGVELCAAAKNVIALAAGGADGMRLGDNAKAALVTRGLAEITRLAVALGGEPATLAGLAGLGDLVLTATGTLSRNRALGMALARGDSPAQAAASTRMVAEGVPTVRTALALAAVHQVSMPICEEVAAVLFRQKAPAEALASLLGRAATREDATTGGRRA